MYLWKGDDQRHVVQKPAPVAPLAEPESAPSRAHPRFRGGVAIRGATGQVGRNAFQDDKLTPLDSVGELLSPVTAACRATGAAAVCSLVTSVTVSAPLSEPESVSS